MSRPIPRFQKGTKVLIINTGGRNDSHLGKKTTITRAYGHGGWLLALDMEQYWWPSEYLKVLCCGAKSCMWHKKDSK